MCGDKSSSPSDEDSKHLNWGSPSSLFEDISGMSSSESDTVKFRFVSGTNGIVWVLSSALKAALSSRLSWGAGVVNCLGGTGLSRLKTEVAVL